MVVVCRLVVWVEEGEGAGGSCLVIITNIQWLLFMLIGSKVCVLLILCFLFLRMIVG